MKIKSLRKRVEFNARSWVPIIVLASLGLWYSTGLSSSAQELTLRGTFMQGGLVVGSVLPGSKVMFEGRSIRVSDQGVFVIGFGREEPSRTQLKVHYPNGKIEQRQLIVGQRQFKIQRIDGLPPRQVTPKAEDLERINKEAALIRKTKRIDGATTDFLTGFTWPVDGQISGVYGSQRVLNGTPKRPHYGVDIAASTGTPVRAPAPGMVSLVYPDMYFTGGTVMVDHGHGLSSIFIHLSKTHVTEGQRVERGDIIAEVGATGRATGPHLHWGMNWFDRRLDPQLIVGSMSAAGK